MATPRYFQGSTVTGPVYASTATCFADVVELLNVCPTLPLTRKAFLALSEKERNTAKQVPFFVPACFRESPSKRIYDQATHCNLVFLDIDSEKEHRDGKWVETGRSPAAPFSKDPELLHEALRGLNFIAHLTASSTPEKPRMRVIVEADEIPLDLYPKAVEYVASLLGLPSITKESKVAVQPMFNTVMFRDDTEDDHPILAKEVKAKLLSVEMFAHHPSTPNPQGLNGKNGSNGHHPSSLDGLEFLRAPVDEITLEIAKEALGHIDADCSYHEWLSIAACLKHQFCPLEEDEAYALFDEWSAGGTKYASADETRAKWNSLRPTPIGREPKTIRSLLKTASQAGWDDTRVKEKGYTSLVEWMGSATSITSLIEDGVRKIISTPQLSAVQEGMLLDQLKVHAKDKFQYRASVTDLRKTLVQLREQQRGQQKEDKEKKIPKWANGLCFVSSTGEFFRTLTGEKYKPQSFNMKYGRYLLPTPKALALAGIPANESTLSKPLVDPADYVLNYLQIPTFYDYAYSPASPNDMLFVHEKKKYVNTYSPTYPELDHERAEEAGALLLNHLQNLVGEPDYRRTIIDFLAYMVQSPGLKIRWAIFLQSAEGAGKTFLAQLMRAVLGKQHVRTISGESINKGWNEWSFGRQLVVLEEVRAVGHSRHVVMNALKQLITNDDIPIDQRNRDTREVVNTTNYILFSNFHDALALTPQNRRYFVVKSPLQSKAQVAALGENYFGPLFEMLSKNPGGLRCWLNDWKISPSFKPNGNPPHTIYEKYMVEDSASDLTAAVRRMFLEGSDPLLQYDIVSAKVMMEALSLEIGMRLPTVQHLSSVLREEGFEQIGRHLIGNDRHYLWVRSGVTGDPLATAVERVKRNAIHLQMEIVYG